MPITVLFFFFGILSALQFKAVPAMGWLIVLGMLSLLCLFIQIKHLALIGVCGLGCLWALTDAYLILRRNLPPAFENRVVQVEGYIRSVPVISPQETAFDFQILKIQNTAFRTSVHLHYQNCPTPLKVGDHWTLSVKLKRPHALMNPGSMDLEKIYFEKRIHATGCVMKDSRNRCLSSSCYIYPIERIRQYLFYQLWLPFKSNPFCGILLALTLGITAYISQEQWQIFRATGTNHLVAISGLHIGLVAALMGKGAGLVWGKIPHGPLRLPVPYLSSIVGLFFASIYSLLAGFSASTQRSFIMIAFYMISILSKRQVTTFHSLIFAFGVIILLDPFIVNNAGFWLSFIAVFLLIFGMNGRLPNHSLWWRWGRAQWVVTVGMVPTLLVYFKQASFLSIPANMLAIPWISFLVVPICLIGSVVLLIWHKGGLWVLKLAIYLLSLIWYYLEQMTHLIGLIWSQAFNSNWEKILAHFSAYFSLLPAGLFYPTMIAMSWIPCLWPHGVSLKPGALQFVTFDVGQGLATLVRTPHHALIFDTGAKLTSNYDMGKVVVVPYLLQQGVKKLDIMVVSHGDNDHIGGAQSILEALAVSKILTSVPEKFKGQKVSSCQDGLQWTWDNVHFQFLSPAKGQGLDSNNQSCVLKVSIGKHAILLTGDIEKAAEFQLLMRHPKDLSSTILVVPHHGSHTSSTESFITAVSPHYAIISCGYLNRYHHPHPQILKRYKERQVILFNTVNSGAVSMTLSEDSDKVEIEEYRKTHKQLWH